jgi:hypothetical protein
MAEALYAFTEETIETELPRELAYLRCLTSSNLLRKHKAFPPRIILGRRGFLETKFCEQFTNLPTLPGAYFQCHATSAG